VPKLHTIQTNFSAGEISPKMLGRLDAPKYQNGAENLTNVRVALVGYAERTPGTRFIYDAGAGVTAYLMPLTITPELTGYQIEFRSDGKIRFYTANALIKTGNPLVPYEISHPYATAKLPNVTWEQNSNELYFWHGDYAPRRLKRTTDTSWTLEEISFSTTESKAVQEATYKDNIVTVVMKLPHHFESGMLIRMSGAEQADYNGLYQITVTDDMAFTYQVNTNLSGPIPGNLILTNMIISITRVGATAYVTTSGPHGMVSADYVKIQGADQADYNGVFIITVISANSFTYTVANSPAIPATGTITYKKVSSSITRTGSTATVTMFQPHGWVTGNYVRISDADQAEYNGTFQLTKVDDYIFTYQVSGTPATPATGDITIVQAVVSGTKLGWNNLFTFFQAHGLTDGQYVTVEGATEPNYNGNFHITLNDLSTASLSKSNTIITPATGTIQAVQHVVSITRSGSTATVTMGTAHKFKDQSFVQISGANQADYNGIFKISLVTNEPTKFTYTVTGTPATPATGTITAYRKTTTYWSSQSGYPGAGTFFEQSMIMGGSATWPLQIWKSKIGEPENFEIGSGDSDACSYGLAAAKGLIRHLCATKQIIALESSGEHTISGSSEKALTPTNIQAKKRTAYGCSMTRPLIVGDEALFVTKHGKQLRAIAYEWETDSYRATDLSVFAEHLAGEQIISMAQTSYPDPIIYAITASGKLLAITYERQGTEMVLGWTKNTTDGLYKWVSVIPYGNTDQVWLAVQRTIGGVAHTYIEVIEEGRQTHSCITGTDGTGKATWTGLGHLAGKTVDVLADGIPQPQYVVSSGQITLKEADGVTDRTATAVEIGIHYDSTTKDLPPALQLPDGISVGRAMSVNKMIARLHETVGCTLNGEELPFVQVGDGVLNEAVPPFTGDKEMTNTGWDAGTAEIKQTQPLPLRVLAVIKQVTINE